MPTFALLPDFFTSQCIEQPNGILYYVVHAHDSGLGLDIYPKSRIEVLRDAQAAAGYLQKAGVKPRVPGGPAQTISIVMRHGYACLTMFLATSLNRCAPVLISPQNTTEMITALAQTSNSTAIIVDNDHIELASQIQQEIPSILVVHFEAFNASRSVPPTNVNFLPALTERGYLAEKDTACYYMHTSGSTGHPKLIPEVHSSWWDKVHRYAVQEQGHPAVVMTHLQHTQGILRFMALPWLSRDIPVLVESKRPFDGDLLCRLLQQFPGATLWKARELVMMQLNTTLLTQHDSTETGQLTILDIASDDPLDWPYMRFLDEHQIYMVPVSGSDGVCQLIVKAGRFVPADLVNFSDPPGYFSGDLFKAHPAKKGLWKHVGRRGSVTVLSNGKKTDNGQIRSLITRSPAIRDIVVFGEGHVQNGVIIWPASTFSNHETTIDTLWPVVKSANDALPPHSRIVKELVIVASASKPFALSDKGSVREFQTLRLYEQEIENTYASLESGSVNIPLPLHDDGGGILTYIRDTVQRLMGKNIDDTTNFFDSGRGSSNDGHPEQIDLERLISNLNDSWSSLGTIDARSPQTDSNEPWVILLTGSRGALGRQLLPLFVASQRVHAVYCLDRRLDPSRATTYSSMPTGNSSLPSGKVRRWEMDISLPHLGLQGEPLQLVREHVTHIVHCAWEVNFNHPLERFVNTHIKGVQTLINIAISTQRATFPRLVFVSSIAAVRNYAGLGKIAERCYFDSRIPSDLGYGQSKYVAERILAHASEKTGLPITIVRAGQLSGCMTTGEWNEHEVFPIFFRSCHLLRRIPDHAADACWVPINLAAQAIFDILQHDASASAPLLTVRHIDSAYACEGSRLVHWLVRASGGTLETVSVESWIQAVQEAEEDIPAKRLLQVFDAWKSDANQSASKALSVESTREISQMAGGIPLTYELVSLYWRHATRQLSVT
ncbi:hypothetical protein CERSUDRAFT_74328 [Gelatoporia subvermispora B]|uniref:Polyketide synthase phosphopantetheine-binding domain-containing protein n=1 Tax=Ceriporiopsis subvermispora (strain B) TaxID=914234 RepID=M2RD14_CERS8|nr:hypothetical protein CERSUDRAFT_74328 [Gelatoporia subvermispora B]